MRFHIHVDAQRIAQDFEENLVDSMGFWRSDFAGHPDGEEGFEPPHHLTYKTDRGDLVRSVFETLMTRADIPGQMDGYIECEYVATDIDIVFKPYRPEVQIPFRLTKKRLEEGSFRESEIHIALSRDHSDGRLIRGLTEMGFFSAYMLKPAGLTAIFTCQGSRRVVDSILPALAGYLEAAGGAAQCSVKEERIIGWWKSRNSVDLPPVIDRVQWCGGSGQVSI